MIAWVVASSFVGIYRMVADALLICFCEDCSLDGGPKFAPQSLLNMIKHNGSVNSNRVAPDDRSRISEDDPN